METRKQTGFSAMVLRFAAMGLSALLLAASEASASHCWNVVNREGDVTNAESVDNGQLLEKGNNLHWIVGYVDGTWTTLRPERVSTILFSRWGGATANMNNGCVGRITTDEGEVGTIEVPDDVRYHVRTSLMERSLVCEEIRMVSRCGRVPGTVLGKAVENLVLLANPHGEQAARKRQEEAIGLILEPLAGEKNAEILINSATERQ